MQPRYLTSHQQAGANNDRTPTTKNPNKASSEKSSNSHNSGNKPNSRLMNMLAQNMEMDDTAKRVMRGDAVKEGSIMERINKKMIDKNRPIKKNNQGEEVSMKGGDP